MGDYFTLEYFAQVAPCSLRGLKYMRARGDIPFTPFRTTKKFPLYTLQMVEAFVFPWRRYRKREISRKQFLAEMNNAWPKTTS